MGVHPSDRRVEQAWLPRLDASELEQLRAGQASQRVLLTATAADLDASFISQPVEVGSVRAEPRRLLGGGLWPRSCCGWAEARRCRGPRSLDGSRATLNQPACRASMPGDPGLAFAVGSRAAISTEARRSRSNGEGPGHPVRDSPALRARRTGQATIAFISAA